MTFEENVVQSARVDALSLNDHRNVILSCKRQAASHAKKSFKSERIHALAHQVSVIHAWMHTGRTPFTFLKFPPTERKIGMILATRTQPVVRFC